MPSCNHIQSWKRWSSWKASPLAGAPHVPLAGTDLADPCRGDGVPELLPQIQIQLLGSTEAPASPEVRGSPTFWTKWGSGKKKNGD